MPARKRLNLAEAEIETQTELQATVAEIARAMLAERDLKNAMDAELQAVRAKYDQELALLASDIDTDTELCARYCLRHPELFPKGCKSLDLTHAVIGFRTGTPKVKVLKKWTLAAALEAIKARKWLQFVRVSEEIDKEAIIAARAEYANDVLAKVGLEVIQTETFYVQPKLEDQPTGVKQEVA